MDASQTFKTIRNRRWSRSEVIGVGDLIKSSTLYSFCIHAGRSSPRKCSHCIMSKSPGPTDGIPALPSHKNKLQGLRR